MGSAIRVHGASKRRMQGQPVIFLMTIIVIWSVARVGALHKPGDHIPGAPIVPQNETAPISVLSQARDDEGRKSRAPTTYPNFPGARQLAAQHMHNLLRGQLKTMHPRPPDHQPLRFTHPDYLTPESGPAAVEGKSTIVAIGEEKTASKWALYAWAHYRSGDAPTALAGNASYGGSQAGAILRYRPWDKSGPLAPTLFVRATSALRTRQQMLAAGASVQPFSKVPVHAHLEYRQSIDGNSRDDIAAGLSGGLYSDRLPGGFALNSYGQAGVIGTSDPDYYFDLQMVGERQVISASKYDLRLGAGVWAGGQTDSSAPNDSFTHRVDIGPHARIALPIIDRKTSIAIDWRHRVAGNAAPGSGLAVTLVADF